MFNFESTNEINKKLDLIKTYLQDVTTLKNFTSKQNNEIDKILEITKTFKNMKSYSLRLKYITQFGFVLPTKQLINKLSKEEKVLEVCCGTGFLSKLLELNNVNIIATDLYDIKINKYFTIDTSFIDIEYIDACSAIEKYHDRTILASWLPANRTLDFDIYKKMKSKQKLFLISEPMFGCTGSDEGFQYLKNNFKILDQIKIDTFYGINDSCYVFQKK